MANKFKPRRNINAPTSMPEAPEWFNDGQTKIYNQLGKKVLDMKVWEDSDFHAFCILVDNLYGYQEATKIVAKEGVMIKGRDHHLVRHPATIARNACWTNIQPLLVAFGLTPSARAAMGLTGDKDEDPIQEFLNGNSSKPTVHDWSHPLSKDETVHGGKPPWKTTKQEDTIQ